MELVANQTDDTSQGDIWYYDESASEGCVEKSNETSDIDREWQKRHNQFHTIGYRDGLIAGKEAAAQEGFNIGFKDSVFIGYRWGLVRGISSAMACLPCGLKRKLVDTEESRNKFQCLHEQVKPLSTIDALKLFDEYQKRKLAEQDESGKLNADTSDSNNQSLGFNAFEYYYGQLWAIITESHLPDLHLEINL